MQTLKPFLKVMVCISIVTLFVAACQAKSPATPTVNPMVEAPGQVVSAPKKALAVKSTNPDNGQPVVTEAPPAAPAATFGDITEPTAPAEALRLPLQPATSAKAASPSQETAPKQLIQDANAQPKAGFMAPDFSLKTIDGQQVQLSDLRGKTVLVSYWATWCIPCKEELPELDKIQQEYKDKGLVIITIDAIEQDKVEAVQNLVGQLNLGLPVLLDEDNTVYQQYKVLFFPTSFLVGSDGMIQQVMLGSKSSSELRALIDQALTQTQ
jgi:peroxiredoxin